MRYNFILNHCASTVEEAGTTAAETTATTLEGSTTVQTTVPPTTEGIACRINSVM